MKKCFYFPLFLLLMTIVWSSCKKDTIVYADDYEKSLRAFIEFKKSSNNSYCFMVSSGSWTGYSDETVITVKNGTVTGRSYIAKYINYQSSGEIIVIEQWEEDETTLGSHDKGFAAINLDEVYQRAKSEWLLKRNDATTYFEAKNEGMISSCGYVEDGCQDDCFRGITISYIEKIQD